MKNRSDLPDASAALEKALAGLGEFSVRKTYYPELQQRLQELERFRAFIDQSNDAMFLIRVPTGRIVDVNDSACRQMGWSREEFLEASIFERTGLGGSPGAEELIRSPEDTGAERALAVTELFARNGERFPAELTLNRMYFYDGTYVLAVARDLTERKRLEEQLLQSQKMEALGQLAGGVAHDFNNILMVIMGYGAVLERDEALAVPQREKVDQIVEAAERAAQLTQSLLAFSRKQAMKPRAANLNDIVLDMEKFLARIIGEDVQLKTAVDGTPLLVEVDSGQIGQVLINLATNARDAMPKGGVLTIETGLQVVDHSFVQACGHGAPGRYAVIAVSDTGVGMDEKTRSKIFEPFFTTKEPGKGTGLGMAIVYGIVKQHGGFINVYSEPLIGTTFRIYIPLLGGEGAKIADAAADAPPRGGEETILLAEDEAAVRKLVAEILAGSGYRVILAEDGVDAVAKFEAHRDEIRLILMDVIMPRLSGKEAWDRIRGLGADVRVIFTSGYTMDVIRAHDALDEGAELVMKPVPPLELLRRVRDALDRG